MVAAGDRGATGTYTYTAPNDTISIQIYESVAAVPKPATWTMMLLGFGAVGGAARYRRRKTNVAFA